MKQMLEHTKIQRVVTFLNRDEVDFLDKVGKDALFSSGIKLSRSKLISWLVDIIKELDINGQNIKSESDFENRIKDIFSKQITLPPATDKFAKKEGGAR